MKKNYVLMMFIIALFLLSFGLAQASAITNDTLYENVDGRLTMSILQTQQLKNTDSGEISITTKRVLASATNHFADDFSESSIANLLRGNTIVRTDYNSGISTILYELSLPLKSQSVQTIAEFQVLNQQVAITLLAKQNGPPVSDWSATICLIMGIFTLIYFGWLSFDTENIVRVKLFLYYLITLIIFAALPFTPIYQSLGLNASIMISATLGILILAITVIPKVKGKISINLTLISILIYSNWFFLCDKSTPNQNHLWLVGTFLVAALLGFIALLTREYMHELNQPLADPNNEI